MNCPNCGSTKSIHAIDPVTAYREYTCDICNREFYGKNMRDAINNAKAMIIDAKPEENGQ